MAAPDAEKRAALTAVRTYLQMQELEREEALDELATKLGVSDERARELWEEAEADLL